MQMVANRCCLAFFTTLPFELFQVETRHLITVAFWSSGPSVIFRCANTPEIKKYFCKK